MNFVARLTCSGILRTPGNIRFAATEYAHIGVVRFNFPYELCTAMVTAMNGGMAILLVKYDAKFPSFHRGPR